MMDSNRFHDVTIVFAHGFGLNHTFWMHLKPQCTGALIYSLDNFSMEACKTRYLVGVGHSFGYIRLLNTPYPWTHLLGLNAFIDFLGGERQRYLEWRQFCRSIEQDPYKALRHFYDRAGLHALSLPQVLAVDGLKTELQALIEPVDLLTIAHQRIDMTIIATQDDPIVPWHISKQQFEQTAVRYKVLKTGLHALGYCAVPEVLQMMLASIKEYNL